MQTVLTRENKTVQKFIKIKEYEGWAVSEVGEEGEIFLGVCVGGGGGRG